MRGASFIFILPSLRIIPPFHRAALVLWESFSSTITAPGASIKPFNPLYFIYKIQDLTP